MARRKRAHLYIGGCMRTVVDIPLPEQIIVQLVLFDAVPKTPRRTRRRTEWCGL
jgi:hypothetical protein